MAKESEPLKRYKEGAVLITVWENDGANGKFNSFQVQKTYTLDDGETFKYTNTFGALDFEKLAELITKVRADFPLKKKGK